MNIFVFWCRVFSRTQKNDSLLRIQSEKSAVDAFEKKKERRIREKEEEIEECEGVVFIQKNRSPRSMVRLS